jgi:hypothetical protein
MGTSRMLVPGMSVGMRVFVVMSIGLRVGDGVVGSRVSLVMGRLEGTTVGTEIMGDRDGTEVGDSSFFLEFFIPFPLLGPAVGEKLLDSALIFRCSLRKWRWCREVLEVAVAVASVLSPVVAAVRSESMTKSWLLDPTFDNDECKGFKTRVVEVRCTMT